MIKRIVIGVLGWGLSLGWGFAQNDLSYQTPPKAIADLVDAPLTPQVSIDANGEWMLLMERPGYPSIEELAQPELRLAGYRINPRTNGASRSYTYNGLTIKSTDGKQTLEVKGLPENPRIENVSWSPDGQKIAFTLILDQGIELWVIDVASAQAQKMTEAVINDALGGLPYTWLSDSQTLVYKSVLPNRGEAPAEKLVPAGPVVQENTGKKAAVRTYQDLLKNPYDEELFTYYGSSQLMSLNLNGQSKKIGSAGVIRSMSSSPDGKYLLVNTVKQPYSYIVPASRFPMVYEIWNQDGEVVKTIAEIPVADNIPKGFGAVRTGPRSFDWRNDHPATLSWVEAQDGGDPAKEVAVRDRLFTLNTPFSGEAKPMLDIKLRYGGVDWGNDDLAIAYEYWWTTRQYITSQFAPKEGNASKRVLFDRSFEDRYNDPGSFVTEQNEYGESVLLMAQDNQTLYLTGQGASPEGNRPFVDEFNLETKENKRLWRSEAPYYEYPVRILDMKKREVITRRESKTEPPNYFLRNLNSDKLQALTDFPHPYPELKDIEKQVVKYKREDGLDLSGDLYLPKGFQKGDQPLPVLMWAYPDEYKSKAAAGQVSGSPYEFIRLGWYSPLYWVARGYAILDDPSMPVVGEGDQEPNDVFREQLVANAKAAIDQLVEMGVADPKKVAVGGHSYGAFMTANLLAHSDLFAAGIARSGAYNRTLTPFGFQSEERTYW